MANAEDYAVGVLELAAKINPVGAKAPVEGGLIYVPLSDLGIDSLDMVDLVMECEERWSVEINEDNLPVPTTALHIGKVIEAFPRRED